MADIYLDGFGLSNYRSFGQAIQKIGPLQKINYFIGQNNSGKSNILLFIKNHFSYVFQRRKSDVKVSSKFTELDMPCDFRTSNVNYSIALNLDGENYQKLKDKYLEIVQQRSLGHLKRFNDLLDRLLSSRSLSNSTRITWFPFISSSLKSEINLDLRIVDNLLQENIMTHDDWRFLWGIITKQSGGDIKAHWVPEVLNALNPINFDYPNIEIIPAIRRIGDATSNMAEDYSGIGIIDKLAKLQNPKHNEQHLKEKFEEINKFVREVVNNKTAKIEIPYERDVVLVHMDGKSLPISSLGTGIHEVVILAAAATVLEKMIICIEEPELHLHPILQKRLCKYLLEKTNNQYLISTHSAHLLDTPNTGIFHVRYENNETVVENVINSTQKTSIFSDLGYRASDLLQSNCIIWVEGPSDRIYLNYWISACDSNLIEGIHYSIMFYGGRLLSHLTASDLEINEFISLRRLNRHICIVIDSDKSKENDNINKTKDRIKLEFDEGLSFAWITKGREIENYIDPEIMEKAIKKINDAVTKLVNKEDHFAHIYYYYDNNNDIIDNVDKIKIAHSAIEEKPNLDILDLKVQIKKLIDFINSANGMG